MEFTDLLVELKSTTSKKEKEIILGDYMNSGGPDAAFIKFLLRQAFDPNVLHHVVMKKKDIPLEGSYTLYEVKLDVVKLFSALRDELSPIKNKASVLEVMEMLRSEDQDALLGVVNKRLQCGVSISTLNKVCPDFIQVIKIGLAKSYNPKQEHNYPVKFYWSYKLDGQRVFCIRNHRGWSKHSRAGDYLGNRIDTLDHWDEELEYYHDKTGANFLDGEAYKHGMKFEEITSLVKSSVNKKDASSLEYHIFFVGKAFDLAEASAMNSIAGTFPNTLFESFKKYKYLVGVKQEVILNDESIIYEKIDEAVEKGYEGIMLRSFDVLYDFKRSNNLLKAKKSKLSGTIERTDVYVEDIEYGEMVVREDGKEEIENLPVALFVCLSDDPSCKQMKVGSGFSLSQRREWADDESLVVGKVVEVEYQGFGARGSMRFPVFLRVRADL